MQLDIKVEGMADLINALAQVEKGIVDFRQLGTWNMVQAEFYKIAKSMFSTAGSAGKSGQWKPLTPKYALQKLRKFNGPTQINVATGRFQKSMTSSGGEAIDIKTAQEMTLGSKVKYSGYVQAARPVVDFTPAQEKQLLSPIQLKLKQLIAAARLRDERGF